MLVLRTLGAKQRRLLGGRRPRAVDGGEPEAVPTTRATVVNAKPLGSVEDADAWLDALRSERERMDEELAAAEREINLALRAHRVCATDASVRDISVDRALVVRVGYGSGEEVADAHWTRAYEVPPDRVRQKRVTMLAPQERLAAILGGREEIPPGEELLLRARADIDAGRLREAALQARVALEALAVDLDLAGLRAPVGAAANAALGEGSLDGEELEDAVAQMERAVRRRRLEQT